MKKQLVLSGKISQIQDYLLNLCLGAKANGITTLKGYFDFVGGDVK